MMNFLERVLRMPRVVLTVMALLLVAGGISYTSLPKESFPAIDIPYFYVSVSQTGVSPGDAERLLAKPIEDRVKELDGLVNYTATSTTGHASVFLEFDVNADADKALADIRAAIDGVSGELPDDAASSSAPSCCRTSWRNSPTYSRSRSRARAKKCSP
jgi:multidrug efflux pump